MSKESLDLARKTKRDEFYTRTYTLEKELPHYEGLFKGKSVLCNCNDGLDSAFTQYFLEHFKELGLKKLTAISYENALRGEKRAVRYVYTGDGEISEYELISGDYRSDECLELLEEADIIATNPPFSQFREFLTLLIEKKKEFLILGNLNTLFTKDLFKYFIEGEFKLGVSLKNGHVIFDTPEEYENDYAEVTSIRWFTNLKHNYTPQEYPLTSTYNSHTYPTFDNFQAINIDNSKKIPKDYYGLMAVPITFIDKLNPAQFEVKGLLSHGSDSEYDLAKPILNGKEKYKRLVIQRRKNVG